MRTPALPSIDRPPSSRAWALAALLLLVPAASIGTALAMTVESTAGTPFGSAAYGVAKAWFVVFPVLWLLLVERGRLSMSPARHGGVGTGLALGTVICAVIAAVYLSVGRAWIDPELVRRSAETTGLASPLSYVLFALYICTINAVLEEYVWRWFVFRQCETLLPGGRGVPAIVLSAALFTVHHVIAVKAQFGWDVTALASLGVFAGGCLWSWCYLRYRSIWPGYLSHVLVDVAIFTIGWALIFGGG